MNDLPVTDLPPNVAHLRRHDDGEPIPPDIAELSTDCFNFDIVPFVDTFTGFLDAAKSKDDPTFGLAFDDCPIQKQAFVTATRPHSASLALCLSY